ncbi:Uncharacterised protein [Streptococcus pneumoniae]|nr:Uncharacterised protein [Streptococcus pneumoniae]
MPQGEHHRDLAAHRVAQQVDRPVGGEAGAQVGGHPVRDLAVVHPVRPGRGAVVRQIDQLHREVVAQLLGRAGEVPAPAHEAVQERDAARALPDAGGGQGGVGRVGGGGGRVHPTQASAGPRRRLPRLTVISTL